MWIMYLLSIDDAVACAKEITQKMEELLSIHPKLYH